MITLFDAIRVLNPIIVTLRGNVAYDANEQEVTYDKDAAQAKLTEMQAAEVAAQETQATAKKSALAKLAALGLSEDEVTALIG